MSDGFEAYKGQGALVTNQEGPVEMTQWRHLPRLPLWKRLWEVFSPKPRHLYITFNFATGGGKETYWRNAEAWLELPPDTERFAVSIKTWENGQVSIDRVQPTVTE